MIGRIDLANGDAAYAFGRVSAALVGLLARLDDALYVLTRGGIVRVGSPGGDPGRAPDLPAARGVRVRQRIQPR